MAAKRTRDDWRVLIDDMKSSGLTQRQWCQTSGINYNTMQKMHAKVKGDTSPQRPKPDTKQVGSASKQHNPASWLMLPSPTESKSNKVLRIEIDSIKITIEVSK